MVRLVEKARQNQSLSNRSTAVAIRDSCIVAVARDQHEARGRPLLERGIGSEMAHRSKKLTMFVLRRSIMFVAAEGLGVCDLVEPRRHDRRGRPYQSIEPEIAGSIRRPPARTCEHST